MVQIYNSELFREIQDSGKLQSNAGFPNQLAEKIVPVMEVNPKMLRRSRILGSSTGTSSGVATIFTSVANQDTYLTGFQISIIKDATCDIADGTMFCYVYQGGAQIAIARIPLLTTTAQSHDIFLNFEQPIKIDRNTAFTITGTFTAGKLIRSGVAYGYTDEQSLA